MRLVGDNDFFENYYDAIVSLGNSCVVAENIRMNRLFSISSPFDWIVSLDTSQISRQFDTKFVAFFNKENQQLAENQDEEGHFVVLDGETNFVSRHDIPKDVCFDPDTFKTLESKFKHKVESFYRRIDFCKKVLFIRSANDVTNSEIVDLKKSLVQSFNNTEVYLLILRDSLNDSVHKIDKSTWVIYSKFNYTGINPNLSWKGDYKAWNKLFSKIKILSYLERLEEILTERLNNRTVVVWGMHGNFHEIESLLQRNGLDYYAYDKELSRTMESALLFKEPAFFLDKKKFFVIVNTRNYFSEIFKELSKKKFEAKNDFFFY
jgi:hypothetical protein